MSSAIWVTAWVERYTVRVCGSSQTATAVWGSSAVWHCTWVANVSSTKVPAARASSRALRARRGCLENTLIGPRTLPSHGSGSSGPSVALGSFLRSRRLG